MKDIRTGDQSGGLKPEHGGSTPTKTGKVGGDENTEVATSTEDKNVPGAFAQQPDSKDKSGLIDNGSTPDNEDNDLSVTQY